MLQNKKTFHNPEKETSHPTRQTQSISQAAQAKALADIGYQVTQIAYAKGLLTRTVNNIIYGRNGWGEIIDQRRAFKQYRSDTRRKMRAASINLSQKPSSSLRTESRQSQCAT